VEGTVRAGWQISKNRIFVPGKLKIAGTTGYENSGRGRAVGREPRNVLSRRIAHSGRLGLWCAGGAGGRNRALQFKEDLGRLKRKGAKEAPPPGEVREKNEVEGEKRGKISGSEPDAPSKKKYPSPANRGKEGYTGERKHYQQPIVGGRVVPLENQTRRTLVGQRREDAIKEQRKFGGPKGRNASPAGSQGGEATEQGSNKPAGKQQPRGQ